MSGVTALNPEDLGIAKPKVIDVSADVVGISSKEMNVRFKNCVIFLEKGRSGLKLSVWCDEEGKLTPLVRTQINDLWGVDGLDLENDVKDVIKYYVSNWEWLLEQKKAEILLRGNIKVLPSVPSDKETLAYELARKFIDSFGAVGVYYETSRGKSLAGIFCYENGTYSTCEEWLKSQYIKDLEKTQQLRATKAVLDEALNKVVALNSTTVSYENVRPLVAFENGVFDWEVFMETGDLSKSFKPFDKSLFILHKIPYTLDDVLKNVRSGLEKYIPPKTADEVLLILKQLSPKSYELLRSWAYFKDVSNELLNSRMEFLLEMIGRALLPGYRLYDSIVLKDIFVLLGPPNSGKSTFLISLLGDMILGSRNYAISKISSLTTDNAEDIRRLFGSLYNVLAVFLPDVSKRERVYNWSYVRSVSGGDPVEARRLKENIFWYYPAYKFYMSSNDPPRISEEGSAKEALLSRFKVMEFKNVFKGQEINLKSYLSEEDVKTLILCSLYAIRIAYHRNRYSHTGVFNIEDLWERYTEPSYKLVMELIERGQLQLNPALEITSGDLYQLVSDYARKKAKEELGEEADAEEMQIKINSLLPGDQPSFTRKMKERLKRFGVTTSNNSGITVFKGIGVPKEGGLNA